MVDVAAPLVALEDLLAACQAGLAAAGFDVPAGPGVTHGKPVVDDCEGNLLAAYLESIVARPFGERRPSSPGDLQRVGWHAVALLRVELWSCAPTLNDVGNPPSFAETFTSASDLLAMAWAMFVWVGAKIDAGELFEVLGGKPTTRDDVGVGTMTPLDPTGATAGWRLNYEVLLGRKLVDPPPGS